MYTTFLMVDATANGDDTANGDTNLQIRYGIECC